MARARYLHHAELQLYISCPDPEGTMNDRDSAALAKAYLDEICMQIDRTGRLFRPRRAWREVPSLAGVAAVGLALCGSGCGSNVNVMGGDGPDEVCDNQIDDDGDGKIDCSDPDCSTFVTCGAAYAAPVEICDNQVDDDYDGKIDCDDEDCTGFPGCAGFLYAAPTEICDNQLDDDGDGKIDCADEDCVCDGPAYAAPFEICDNQIDDDFDGKVDCYDEDCAGFPGCNGELYGVPFEHCSNEVDDDGDGKIDCADEDCKNDPSCK